MRWLIGVAFLLLTLPFLRAATPPSEGLQSKPWKAPAWADTLRNPFAGDPAAIEAGAAIYKQQCAVCHGARGRGDGPAGIALNPRPANLTSKAVQEQSDGALYWKITTGRGPMPAFKSILTDEQRWQVVAYLRTLAKTKK